LICIKSKFDADCLQLVNGDFMTDTNYVVRNSCSVGTNQLECLDLLTEEEYAFLQSKMVDVSYQKGEVICKQGSFISHVMVLREGLVKTYIEGIGDNLVLQIFSPVNVIGLSNLYEGNSVLHHSTQAYVDSKLSLIEINAFKHLLRTNAVFASKMIALLAAYSLTIHGRFFCLTQKQTYGRLADLLLCLSNRVYKNYNFPLHLSRKEIAELAGMSIESIARIITKFKSDGLIEITCDQLKILDPEKLEMISRNG